MTAIKAVRKHLLKDMTFIEFRERLSEDPVILISLGSQEEQGPVAPMGDYMLTDVLAGKIAEKSGAIAAPIMPFGYADYFRTVPGGIQLRPETFSAILTDMIENFTDHGINKIAILNGHSGNYPLIDQVIRKIKRLGITTAPKLAIGDGALGFWAAIQEEFPETNHQLCWVHKTANVLDKLPKSLQGKAKTMIHDIYLAPTKVDANNSFDIFIEEFEAKYPKAVDCMRKHRDRLLEFYNYPAEHWQSIRSTNVIESVFATVRLRTYRTKGCGSRIATLTMVFKLIQSAQKRWIKIRFPQRIKQVWEGIIFEDGLEAKISKPLELVEV